MPASCHHLAWPKSFQGSYWLLINEQQHSGYGGQLSNDFFRREYAPYLNFKAVVGSASAVVIFRACNLRLMGSHFLSYKASFSFDIEVLHCFRIRFFFSTINHDDLRKPPNSQGPCLRCLGNYWMGYCPYKPFLPHYNYVLSRDRPHQPSIVLEGFVLTARSAALFT